MPGDDTAEPVQPAGVPRSAAALVVVAHPDDESFGLGAVLASLTAAGTQVAVLCLTHGEASTLAADLAAHDPLHVVRAAELEAAAHTLGLAHVELCDHPDGHLSEIAISQLADLIEARVEEQSADLLIVFDEGGVTGHPDHIHATEAAVTAADRLTLPVLAWAVPQAVAEGLNTEFGTCFAGRSPAEVDLWITVDRDVQLAAIACHRSQSGSNPVLWRRLELSGTREPLRWLRAPSR